MVATNFAAQQPTSYAAWSMKTWKAARDMSFWTKLEGDGPDSVVQVVRELTKSEGGELARIGLVADLVQDGVINDNQMEGSEESLQSYWSYIKHGRISHGVKNKGRYNDSISVLKARTYASDQLANWLAQRKDRLMFLTASGISYAYDTDGSAAPTGSDFINLPFAADVSAPTSNRHVRIDASTGLEAGSTAAVATGDVLTYQALVDINAYADNNYVAPINEGGNEYRILVVSPTGMAQLKKDPDYLSAIINAEERGLSNPFFTGATVTVDGLVIYKHRKVYTTTGAASGSKWGAAGTVDGSRALLLGRQALAFVELEAPIWDEYLYPYNRQWGTSIDASIGIRKPTFYSIYNGSTEDFGIIAIDHSLQ
jgi:N4-gp56 family major capsid protein